MNSKFWYWYKHKHITFILTYEWISKQIYVILWGFTLDIWLVIRQKCESQNGCFGKTNIFYPLIRTCACAYQGVKTVRFSENLTCFVFLKHPFSDLPFCLITDYLNLNKKQNKKKHLIQQYQLPYRFMQNDLLCKRKIIYYS